MQKIRCELEKMFPFCSAIIELYIETHRHATKLHRHSSGCCSLGAFFNAHFNFTATRLARDL